MASYYAQFDVTLNNTNVININTKITAPKVPRTQRALRPELGRLVSPSARIALKAYNSTIGALAIANSKVGSYTGNKNAQTNVGNVLKIGLALGAFAYSPIGATVGSVAYSANRFADIAIERAKSEEESKFKQSYLGNMTTSGSRWRR